MTDDYGGSIEIGFARLGSQWRTKLKISRFVK
jgi:hypothetical protein